MVGRMVYNIDTKNGLGARFLWLMTLTPKILTKAADRVLPSNNYNYWTVTNFIEVGWRGAPVTAGDWRLRAVATLALGFPSLVGGGKLSQTSDRLASCGLVDGRRLFSGCGGGGRLLKF